MSKKIERISGIMIFESDPKLLLKNNSENTNSGGKRLLKSSGETGTKTNDKDDEGMQGEDPNAYGEQDEGKQTDDEKTKESQELIDQYKEKIEALNKNIEKIEREKEALEAKIQSASSENIKDIDTLKSKIKELEEKNQCLNKEITNLNQHFKKTLENHNTESIKKDNELTEKKKELDKANHTLNSIPKTFFDSKDVKYVTEKEDIADIVENAEENELIIVEGNFLATKPIRMKKGQALVGKPLVGIIEKNQEKGFDQIYYIDKESKLNIELSNRPKISIDASNKSNFSNGSPLIQAADNTIIRALELNDGVNLSNGEGSLVDNDFVIKAGKPDQKVENVKIENNKLTGKWGASFYKAGNSVVSGNDIQTWHRAVNFTDGSSNNEVTKNSILTSGDSGHGVHIWCNKDNNCSESIIKENIKIHTQGADSKGIFVGAQDRSKLSGNIIQNNRDILTENDDAYGILILARDNSTVEANDIENNKITTKAYRANGVFLQGLDDSILKENQVKDNEIGTGGGEASGVYLKGENNSQFKGNKIGDNIINTSNKVDAYGIFVDGNKKLDDTKTVIANNKINTGYASPMVLTTAQGITIKDNTLSVPKNYGLYLNDNNSTINEGSTGNKLEGGADYDTNYPCYNSPKRGKIKFTNGKEC